MIMPCTILTITVASRTSPLAHAQVREVLAELQHFYPAATFACTYQKTIGDIDRNTSLRNLDKTNFFTKELDEAVLSGVCRIAIHAAKDLPEPLPKGIAIAAITLGVDPADSLVLRDGESLTSLPAGAIIASSSVRRENAVRALRKDVAFADVRGTIEERLHRLNDGTADGVVVAEAALIRLGLTHLNRIKLPGKSVPLQGKLAVACRADDDEMLGLFASINAGRPL